MANELVVSVQKEIQRMENSDGLKLPQGYSVGNALNSAWLILSDDSKGPSMLQKCDQRSVSKALLNMAIQGLSPAKNQCYFIPYGNQCTLQRSYFGSVTVLKQLSSVNDIKAQAVFKDDEFEIGADDEMNLVVKKYVPKFENRDKPIIGAFAYVLQNDGKRIWTVMTKKEIDASWSQARTHNVQNKFGQEMAQRTIINRAAKLYINSSNDNDLFVKSINDTTEAEYNDGNDTKDVTPKKVTDLIGNADTEEPTPPEPVEQAETDEPAEQEDISTNVSDETDAQNPDSEPVSSDSDSRLHEALSDVFDETFHKNSEGDGDDANSTEEGQGELFPPDVHSKF